MYVTKTSFYSQMVVVNFKKTKVEIDISKKLIIFAFFLIRFGPSRVSTASRYPSLRDKTIKALVNNVHS